MKCFRLYYIFIVLWILTSCSYRDDHNINSVTSIPTNILLPYSITKLKSTLQQRPFPQALAIGRLHIENNCLRLITEQDNTSYLVIWSTHIQFQQNSVFDPKSGQQALFGMEAKIGGGVIHLSDSVFGELESPINSDCLGPYWLASGIQ